MNEKSTSAEFDFRVSVIVPAYNVEKFILKCLTSILNQTYSNIEIIVINDGSTDKTRQLLDEIAGTDKRLKIIHQENAGVSVARNLGIKISTGDYIVFVDGDDYIAEDYVKYMVDLVTETKADFCFSKSCYTFIGEKQTKNENIQKISPEKATALLISPNVIVGCWNKIYKRDLIINNNITFSTNLFYGEGLTFITSVSQISNSIGVGNRKVYYYRRNNIDSATTKFDINKIYNGEKALNNIREKLTIRSKKISTMFDLHMCLFSLGAIVRIRTACLKKEYFMDYKRWKLYIRENSFKLLFERDISLYRKLMLIGGCISPWIMSRLDKWRRKRIFNNSVSG
jgi:glycosyltransferase involved in cell wall biosynthesis